MQQIKDRLLVAKIPLYLYLVRLHRVIKTEALVHCNVLTELSKIQTNHSCASPHFHIVCINITNICHHCAIQYNITKYRLKQAILFLFHNVVLTIKTCDVRLHYSVQGLLCVSVCCLEKITAVQFLVLLTSLSQFGDVDKVLMVKYSDIVQKCKHPVPIYKKN